MAKNVRICLPLPYQLQKCFYLLLLIIGIMVLILSPMVNGHCLNSQVSGLFDITDTLSQTHRSFTVCWHQLSQWSVLLNLEVHDTPVLSCNFQINVFISLKHTTIAYSKIIRDAVTDHLDFHALIGPTQHGFCKGLSCVSNLLEFLPSHAIAWNGVAVAWRPSVRLSVCPSVTLVSTDHIHWGRWNFITRLISPMSSLAARQISAI